jgi:hypothetical protein
MLELSELRLRRYARALARDARDRAPWGAGRFATH